MADARRRGTGATTERHVPCAAVLTAVEELRRDDVAELRLVAVPEDPELLVGGDGGRRGRRRGRRRRARLQRGRGSRWGRLGVLYPPPHREDVTGQTFGEGVDDRVLQRVWRQLVLDPIAAPFDAAQISLQKTNNKVRIGNCNNFGYWFGRS